MYEITKDKRLIEDGKEILNVKIEMINPEKAAEMLTHNDGNRNPKKQEISSLIRDMNAGNWKINGETICFDQQGILRDGQNRLKAIVKSGKTFPCLIVTARDAKFYDLGVSRSVSDILAIEGDIESFSVKNTHIIGIVNYALQNIKQIRYSKPEIAKIVRDNQAILEWYSVTKACQYAKKGKLKAPVGCAIVAAYTNYYPIEELENFIEVLTSGISRQEKDRTVIVFRDWMMNTATSKGSMYNKELYYRAQKALKNYRDGVVITRSCPNTVEYYKWEVVKDAE